MEQNLFFHFAPETFLATTEAKQRKPEHTWTDYVPTAIKSKYFSNNIETIRLTLTNTSRPFGLVLLSPAVETRLTASGHRCLLMTDSTKNEVHIDTQHLRVEGRCQSSSSIPHPSPTRCHTVQKVSPFVSQPPLGSQPQRFVFSSYKH